MNDLFSHYQNNTDSINLKDKWTPKITREEKLVKCLINDLHKNFRLKSEFNLQ